MNKEETKEAIEVMQAWVDGKTVEYKDLNGEWKAFEPHDDAAWDWWECKYRIAPEPMEIEVWVNPDGSIVPSGLQLASTGCTKKKFREVL